MTPLGFRQTHKTVTELWRCIYRKLWLCGNLIYFIPSCVSAWTGRSTFDMQEQAVIYSAKLAPSATCSLKMYEAETTGSLYHGHHLAAASITAEALIIDTAQIDFISCILCVIGKTSSASQALKTTHHSSDEREKKLYTNMRQRQSTKSHELPLTFTNR